MTANMNQYIAALRTDHAIAEYARTKSRILNDAPETDPDVYDLFVALGYEPESWDGLWKLPTNPIVYRGHGVVIYREVIYKRGTHQAKYRRNGAQLNQRTRLHIRRDPFA